MRNLQLIIKQLGLASMKDNRSKSTRNFINQSGQVDRSTFNPLVNSISKPSMSKQNHAQKVNEMAQKIMNEVNRLYNQSQIRAITKQMLKEGGSKLFYDVFAILIRGIDQKIDREEVNLDFILDVLRLFNYNGNLNKNIFQPIGAPHTWFHCLSILEFIAQVVSITSAFRHYSRDFLKNREIDKDENYNTMAAVIQKNPEKLRLKLQEDCYQLEKSCDELNLRTSNTELAIKNMHNQQKSLDEIETQISKQKEADRHFQQEIIQQQYQKSRLEGEIAVITSKIEEQEFVYKNLSDQVAGLEYKLAHNEVTPDESVRLEEEIRQGEYQLTIMEQNIQIMVKEFYRTLEISIREIKEAYLKHEMSAKEISKQGIPQFRAQQQQSHNLDDLCSLPNQILSTTEIKSWSIPNEVNRMFSALFLTHHVKNAQKTIEQSRKKIINLKMQQQGLRSKMQNLNDNMLKLKYSIQQVIVQKQNIHQSIMAKEKKAKELRYQIDNIRIKRVSVKHQTDKVKLEIENIERMNDQLMEQIAGIDQDKQLFMMEIAKSLASYQSVLKQSQDRTYEEFVKDKVTISQIHQNTLSIPLFQEQISTWREGQETNS